MRHAIIGPGAVGGLVGGALARAGNPVTLVVRPAVVGSHPRTLRVRSAVLGEFEAPVEVVSAPPPDVDVAWLTVKATALPAAYDLLPSAGVVVPLLNGVEHVAELRERCGDARVVAGTISVQSVRSAPGEIVQASPFIDVRLAAGGPSREWVQALSDELRAAGLDCALRDDELTMLWEKLCFLAPLALCTTAADADLGGVRSDPAWASRLRACAQEACQVADAEGAAVDAEAIRDRLEQAPAGMRSSMQGDVEAGRAPELDAIAGPLLRGGERHGITVAVTRELVAAVRGRAGA